MNAKPSAKAEAILVRLVSSGRYPDAVAVIDQALQVLDEQEHMNFFRARELILAGHNSGPGRELTDEVCTEMERAVDEAYVRGDEPPPHVLP